MLSIRLFPRGRKHQKTYRVVVAQKRSKLDGKFIEDLGHWNPIEKDFKIDLSKFNSWIKKGAQPSLTIEKLVKKGSKQKSAIN